MNRRTRRNHTAAFRAKVAIEAVKGEHTLAALSLHDQQVLITDVVATSTPISVQGIDYHQSARFQPALEQIFFKAHCGIRVGGSCNHATPVRMGKIALAFATMDEPNAFAIQQEACYEAAPTGFQHPPDFAHVMLNRVPRHMREH